MIKPPKILIYDIETAVSLMHGFSLGKQVVRHNQLLKGYFYRPHIMSISYQWVGTSKIKTLTWGSSEADEREMIRKFDAEVAKADVIMGKNNHRFDNKHINLQRMLGALPDCSDWMKRSDDLESQFRKHFYLPSQSLDYISNLLDIGGKNPMEFSDWVAMAHYRMVQLTDCKSKDAKALIQLLTGKSRAAIVKEGKAASKKMFTYGEKDVADTMAIYEYAKDYLSFKFNHAAHVGDRVCVKCGSRRIVKNGTFVGGKTQYQKFICKAKHPYHYAGSCPIGASGTLGKIGK